jgi:hypothetical protein
MFHSGLQDICRLKPRSRPGELYLRLIDGTAPISGRPGGKAIHGHIDLDIHRVMTGAVRR